MMKVRCLILAASLLLVWGSASAQTVCPQGVSAGSAQCGPSSMTAPDPSENAPYVRSLPPLFWADGWGAIATDGHGVAGAVTDLASKRDAKRAAIQECREGALQARVCL